MSTTKKPNRIPLTQTQMHDVWEVSDSDDITEEVARVLKSMGMDTEEVKRTYVGSTREADDGRKTE